VTPAAPVLYPLPVTHFIAGKLSAVEGEAGTFQNAISHFMIPISRKADLRNFL